MATTANRVSAQTSDEINNRLRWQMEERLAYYETHPDQISARLAELDREWDLERTLEANASTLAFTGTMLAATVDRRWLALPAIVTGFLFQHAMQGWCPPLPILRRLGFRTAEEINQERYALKALRGDFDPKEGNKLDTVLRAVGIRRGGA
ncbi:hypothetical protein ACFHWW_18200 [Ensifer sp. P24N7]|uniref:hypothetical protein n=1 Tax=Sinorhizobium sp. P24N7 TaxID=3348358 RepID=UPI0035F4C510